MAIPRSETETRALDTFRPLVEDLNFDDGTLIRFLRARDLDMDRAENMLRKFVEWRVKAKCNQYLGWSVPLELFQFDMYLTGFDIEDRPVFWAKYGFWPSIRDIMDRGLTDDILRYCGKMMDKVYSLLLLTKHQQFIALVDSDGVTYSKIFYEARCWKGFLTLMELVKDYEKNFPELLHKAILFNTPLAFSWGWRFLSPCFADHTLTKVDFYGGGREEWEAALSNNLPKRCIPPQYGGQAVVININEDLTQAWKDHQYNLKFMLNNDRDNLDCKNVEIIPSITDKK